MISEINFRSPLTLYSILRVALVTEMMIHPSTMWLNHFFQDSWGLGLRCWNSIRIMMSRFCSHFTQNMNQLWMGCQQGVCLRPLTRSEISSLLATRDNWGRDVMSTILLRKLKLSQVGKKLNGMLSWPIVSLRKGAEVTVLRCLSQHPRDLYLKLDPHLRK